MAFQIIKENSSNVWRHSIEDGSLSDIILSSGFFKFTGDTFELFSSSGGSLRTAVLSTIEIIDETDTGTPETFTTSLLLTTRLKALGYPYFNEDASAGVVVSVFSRVGAVIATSGDYNSTQVTNSSIVAGVDVTGALNTLSGLTTPNITISGSPVNNQFTVWTSSSEVEGISQATFDGSDFIIGETNSVLTIRTVTGFSEITASNRFDIISADGLRLSNVAQDQNTNFLPTPIAGTTTLTAPTISGVIPLTVNGVAANAAGNIAVTIGLGDMLLNTIQIVTADKIFTNGTLLLDDSDSAFNLVIGSTSGITSADKILTIDVNNSDRSLTFTADAIIGGTNTGDQTITLTGDVTGSGTGSFAATISTSAVTLPKMANIATSRILGRVTASTGNVEVLTGTQTTTLLDVFTSVLQGLVPASGGGSAIFLNADGNFVTPAGAGDVIKVGTPANNEVAVWTGDGTLEGDSNWLWDGSDMTIYEPVNNGNPSLSLGSSSTNRLKIDATFGISDQLLTSISFITSTTNASADAGRFNFNVDDINILVINDSGITIAGDSNVTTGNGYQVNAVEVLNATTLGSSVITSSLTTVGTIAVGTWNGTQIATAFIADDAVTYAKIQNVVGNNVILGNNAGAGGIVDELTATEIRTIINVSDGADVTSNTTVNASGVIEYVWEFAFGDETSDLTVSTGNITFDMPDFATTLTKVSTNLVVAPTGSVATFDFNEAGTSVLSTKVTIDAGETSSETAATPPVISDSALAANATMSVDTDGIGSTIAGAGPKFIIYFTRT